MLDQEARILRKQGKNQEADALAATLSPLAPAPINDHLE